MQWACGPITATRPALIFDVIAMVVADLAVARVDLIEVVSPIQESVAIAVAMREATHGVDAITAVALDIAITAVFSVIGIMDWGATIAGANRILANFQAAVELTLVSATRAWVADVSAGADSQADLLANQEGINAVAVVSCPVCFINTDTEMSTVATPDCSPPVPLIVEPTVPIFLKWSVTNLELTAFKVPFPVAQPLACSLKPTVSFRGDCQK